MRLYARYVHHAYNRADREAQPRERARRACDPTGDTQWTIVGNFGTSDGTPAGTCTTSGTGLAVADGVFAVGGAAKGNAFDGGLTVWVNGALFTTPDTVDVTGSTLTAGPTVLSGLDVTVQHAALASGPILRTLIALHNPAATPVTVTLAVVTNLGSDGTRSRRRAPPKGSRGRRRRARTRSSCGRPARRSRSACARSPRRRPLDQATRDALAARSSALRADLKTLASS